MKNHALFLIVLIHAVPKRYLVALYRAQAFQRNGGNTITRIGPGTSTLHASSFKPGAGDRVPEVNWPIRSPTSTGDGFEWTTLTSKEVFSGKRVILFALPGAFTPTCSSTHLPGFEQHYDELRDQGIDEIYCVSVNDPFVMNAWKSDQGVQKTKLIPDGSAHFTKSMGRVVSKNNLGFGKRSWRYAMIVRDWVIEKIFDEEGMADEAASDPFHISDVDTVIRYLSRSTPRVFV